MTFFLFTTLLYSSHGGQYTVPMTEQEKTQLESFLGYPLLRWIESMPLTAFARLCLFLFRRKSANWAMIRTLTNVLECTPEFRRLLPDELQSDFTAVEASIRKSGRDALLWLYAVAYLFLRNLRDIVGRENTAAAKFPVLEPVRKWEFSQLQLRLADNSFGTTLKHLQSDRKQAYACWTQAGSQTITLALHGLSEEACRSLLHGAVSGKFIEDIFQLREGAFLEFTPFTVSKARASLISHYADSLTPAVVPVEGCLAQLLNLDKAWMHRCLYNANVIDVGFALGRQPKPEKLFAQLKPRLHPLYYLLLEAAGKGELKINRTDQAALRALMIEIRMAGLHARKA